MQKPELTDVESETSLLALATSLLKNRWWLLTGMVVGAAIALIPVLRKPPVYAASASFFPQNSEAAPSGLAGLAGTLGVSLNTGSQTLSPDFYATLLEARVLMLPIVRDTFEVQELGGRRVPFLDLFLIEDGPTAKREEDGVTLLRDITTVSVSRTTGIVQLSVATMWPSVSQAISTALVDGVNLYNQNVREGQAAAERRFVEGRLEEAQVSLRAAEDRLENFMRANPMVSNAPSLMLESERIHRDVLQKQQLFGALQQAYQDVRIREVRDIPVITILESPSVSAYPQPRGRVRRGLIGLGLGGFVVALLVVISSAIARTKSGINPEWDALLATARSARNQLLFPFRIFTRRRRQLSDV